MTEWREQKLSDFMDFNPYTPLSKGIIAKKVTMEKLIPFNRKIQGYEDAVFSGGAKFKNGDTLVARITPCLKNGKTAYVDFLDDEEVAFGSTEFIVLRAKEGISDSRFIFYFAISDEFRDTAIQLRSGTTRQRVDTEALKRKVFMLPPLPEQKAIAEVLSSLDDKIDLLHRENKTLEAMAETLFRQWFIEEAEDDWEEVSLKDIYTFEKGFEPGSDSYLKEKSEDAIRFIRVKDLPEDTASIYIRKNIAEKICTADDLLMSFDGTPGRLNFGLEGAYSSGIRKIYSTNPLYNNLGLKYLIFKSKSIQDTIKAYSDGTVIIHAGSSIDNLVFSFPDENKIAEFNNLIDPIFTKIQLNKVQIRTLTQLRDTLLPKLMSGEVRVDLCQS